MAANMGVERSLRSRAAVASTSSAVIMDTEDTADERWTVSQGFEQFNDLPLTIFLELPGITAGDLDKLRGLGKFTVRSVGEAPAHLLEHQTGFTPAKVAKLQDAAKARFPLEFKTVAELHKLSMDLVKISTGSKDLDVLLKGGVETGFIHAVFGESGSGKTQLALTLAVRCQMEVAQGGAEGKCVYIDTTGGFKAERIAEIAAANGLDIEHVKRNVIVINARSTDQLFEALARTKLYMTENRTSLIVIDSATALFRVEYEGRAMLQSRQARINHMIAVLRECISQRGVAIVLTAETIDDPGSFAPRKDIAGGNIMKHGCHSILQMRKAGVEAKVVCTFKFTALPVAEVKIQIGPKGIEDYVDTRRVRGGREDV